VRGSDTASNPLIWWSPANEERQLPFESLAGLQKLHPEFSANSQYFANYDGPLFKSSELGNYELLKAFPGSAAASPLPTEIRSAQGGLRRPKQDSRFPGAFPLCP